MSDDILEKLGLTKEFVKAALSVKPIEYREDPITIDEKNYLPIEDQKRIRTRLKKHKEFIIARFKSGIDPRTISLLLGVSEESVRSRLRKANLFNCSGPGRPKSVN